MKTLYAFVALAALALLLVGCDTSPGRVGAIDNDTDNDSGIVGRIDDVFDGNDTRDNETNESDDNFWDY